MARWMTCRSADVLPFEKAMLDYLDHNTDILKTIRETEDFTADTEAALDKAVEAFRETFVTSAGKPLVEKKPEREERHPGRTGKDRRRREVIHGLATRIEI